MEKVFGKSEAMAQPQTAAADGKSKAAVVERIEIFTVEFEGESESSFDVIEAVSSPTVNEIVESTEGKRELRQVHW